ncbi:hypothetical protein [Actinophytocola sp.]|jgi:sugar lactone lactonase YvrE|uniref:SMP-30/gluconolactonase/LRE family protein n=1 Tax=Actinophytocola sp. TaxID=1872138 RepID=UPI002EDA01A6
MRRILIATMLGLVLGVAAVPGAAPAVAERGGLPAVLQPAAPNQFPEGVAWDPTRQALLVGSVGSPARITAVGRDGVNRTVVSDPELIAYLGIKVDVARHRILAVYGNPVAPGPTGVAVYDLRTGERIRLVSLASDVPGERAANDLVLTPSGTAYVTDTQAGAVYRVTPAGEVSTVVSDPRLGPSIGANGVVWHPDGYLVVVNYTTGALYRISRGELTEVWTPTPLVGGDGMALRPDGTLVVVTNTLAGVPGSAPAVHELRLVAGGRAAIPVSTRPWPDLAPTTVAVTPYGDYVLDGRMNALLTGSAAADFVLRRI